MGRSLFTLRLVSFEDYAGFRGEERVLIPLTCHFVLKDVGGLALEGEVEIS